MGMKEKLQKSFEDGYAAGKKDNQLTIEVKGYIQGCNDTWDILERILKQTPGIGPKTEKKVIAAVKAFADAEAKRSGYY